MGFRQLPVDQTRPLQLKGPERRFERNQDRFANERRLRARRARLFRLVKHHDQRLEEFGYGSTTQRPTGGGGDRRFSTTKPIRFSPRSGVGLTIKKKTSKTAKTRNSALGCSLPGCKIRVAGQSLELLRSSPIGQRWCLVQICRGALAKAIEPRCSLGETSMVKSTGRGRLTRHLPSYDSNCMAFRRAAFIAARLRWSSWFCCLRICLMRSRKTLQWSTAHRSSRQSRAWM